MGPKPRISYLKLADLRHTIVKPDPSPSSALTGRATAVTCAQGTRTAMLCLFELLLMTSRIPVGTRVAGATTGRARRPRIPRPLPIAKTSPAPAKCVGS